MHNAARATRRSPSPARKPRQRAAIGCAQIGHRIMENFPPPTSFIPADRSIRRPRFRKPDRLGNARLRPRAGSRRGSRPFRTHGPWRADPGLRAWALTPGWGISPRWGGGGWGPRGADHRVRRAREAGRGSLAGEGACATRVVSFSRARHRLPIRPIGPMGPMRPVVFGRARARTEPRVPRVGGASRSQRACATGLADFPGAPLHAAAPSHPSLHKSVRCRLEEEEAVSPTAMGLSGRATAAWRRRVRR